MILLKLVDSRGGGGGEGGAFSGQNGFIYCSADSSNDKVSILSISCVELSWGTFPELSAASRVDSNDSLSVWLNLYLTGSVCMFL